jgi:hypothetical protein
MHAVRFHSLHAHISSTTNTSRNCYGKTIGFHATNITLLSGQILPQILCRLVGDLASFGLEEDFYPG